MSERLVINRLNVVTPAERVENGAVPAFARLSDRMVELVCAVSILVVPSMVAAVLVWQRFAG
jgi:hypothetical protein